MNNNHFIFGAISQQEYEKHNAWGLLASINLQECDHQKITNPSLMKDFIKQLCQIIDMKPHGEPMIEKFAEGDLEGHSLLQFIETSSITIHYDDKAGKRAFIDIFGLIVKNGW